MSNRTFIEKGIALVQKAMDSEKRGQLPEAVTLYSQAAHALDLALKCTLPQQ